MSFFIPKVDPIRIIRRKGDSTDPFVPYVENLKVSLNRTILKEVPDEFYKVVVKDGEESLFEVKSLPKENEFYVDYQTGLVYFSDTQDNKTLSFEYMGTGVLSLSASRVFVDDSAESPSKTLQDFIDEARNRLFEAETKLIETETARQNTIVATNNAISRGNYAQSQGDYAKATADSIKTVWKRVVSKFNDISTTYSNPENGWTVMVTDDGENTGKVYRYENGNWIQTQQHNDLAITELQNQLSEQNAQTQTLTHGQNIINSDQASPLKVEFYGNTLVNKGFKFSNDKWTFASNVTVIDSRNVELNASANGETSYSSNISINGNSFYLIKMNHNGYIDIRYYDETGSSIRRTDYTNAQHVKVGNLTGAESIRVFFANGTDGAGIYTFSDFSLYEIDQATYDKIGVSLTDEDVERMFPYVDSVQHVVNPVVKVSGGNLFDGELELGAINNGNNYATTKDMRSVNYTQVIPNTQYYISGLNYKAGYGNAVSYYDKDKNYLGGQSLGNNGGMFTTTSNTKYVRFRYGSDEKLDIMLNLGSTAKPFVPKNDSYLYTETTLAGNENKKDILYKNESLNRWEKQKWWVTDVVLDGSLSWEYLSTNNSVRVRSYFNSISNPKDAILTNGDTAPLKYSETYGGLTEGQFHVNNYNDLIIKLLPSETEGYDLTTSEGIKDYFSDKNYFLTYQLAESVIEPVTVEGDLSIQGDAQVNVGEGVIPREEVTPQKDTSYNMYRINQDYQGSGTGNYLEHKALDILTIYKNGEADSKWEVRYSSTATDNGVVYALITEEDYDPTATYTVTYEILDKHDFTTNLNEVVAHYHQSIKSSFQQVVSKQSDIATDVSVNIRAIAELYKRVKSLEVTP